MYQVMRQTNVEIVKRSDAGKFVMLPKCWIIERTITWLNRCRRLAKDWKCLRRTLAYVRLASVRLMVRKPCQTGERSRTDTEGRPDTAAPSFLTPQAASFSPSAAGPRQ